MAQPSVTKIETNAVDLPRHGGGGRYPEKQFPSNCDRKSTGLRFPRNTTHSRAEDLDSDNDVINQPERCYSCFAVISWSPRVNQPSGQHRWDTSRGFDSHRHRERRKKKRKSLPFFRRGIEEKRETALLGVFKDGGLGRRSIFQLA